MLHILCSSVSYISFILENLPNGTEKNSSATTEITNSIGEQPGEQIVYNENIFSPFFSTIYEHFFGACRMCHKAENLKPGKSVDITSRDALYICLYYLSSSFHIFPSLSVLDGTRQGSTCTIL